MFLLYFWKIKDERGAFMCGLLVDLYLLEKVKVKGSRKRPGVAQRVPGGLVSQIS
jgi:hypothetical protein